MTTPTDYYLLRLPEVLRRREGGGGVRLTLKATVLSTNFSATTCFELPPKLPPHFSR